MGQTLNEAIVFATTAHADQRRKRTQTPYILHPLESAAIVSLKNDRARTIYPPESVFHVLADHKRLQEAVKADAGDKWQDTGAVFTNATGGWLEGSAVYRCLMRHLENIGVDNIRMHDLRHTFATVSIAAGVDIKTLQEGLGHHDPGFTLRVYGHAQDTMRRAAADKIEQFAAQIQSGTKEDEKETL